MKVLISNFYGIENRGDASLLRILKQEIEEAFGPETHFTAIALHPDNQRAFFPDVDWAQSPGKSDITNRLGKRLQNAWRLFLALVLVQLGMPRWLSGILPASQRKAIENIRDADLMTSVAGGFLKDGNVSIYPQLAQMAIAQHFGTPVILAPQTIGPFKTLPARLWARRVLGRCRFIFYREEISHHILENMGVAPQRMGYFPDLALFDSEVDHAAVDPILADLGIARDERFFCITCVNWVSGHVEPAEKQVHYERELARAIDIVQRETGYTALILNHNTVDMPVNLRVQQMVSGKVVIDESYRSPEAIRGVLHRAQGTIASRFHSCIFALMVRGGVQAISFIHKTDGIMAGLGLPHRVHRVAELDGDKLARATLQDLADPEVASAEIDAAMAGLSGERFATVLRARAGKTGAS